ncbi:TPA: ash family protein [Salmonella enterica]|uniref:Ash family protein n=1 Tax=Salmonella enterica TaxID=28901 RepID=A0A765BVF0_SALER|nr:ash family protein [Salmonella enterica]HAG1897085.1 ash family protein [Salmonella enterica]HAG2404295.1 ash family protein [Salmonella enterica]HAG5378262.1 ash family protein [Salmonella enterica]
MISKTYGELVLINSDYDMGLQIPRGRNTPLQPRPFQWVNWFKCGAMTDTLAQAVARLFNWQRCGLSLTTGAGFCFSVKGNTDHKTPENEFSESIKKGLPLVDKLGYVYPAPHKTGAGISTPNMYTATPDAESVFFVVRYTRHSMAWCVIRQRSYNRRYVALLAYHAAHNGTICGCCVRLRPAIDAQNRISRRPIMVTLAGQPQGWPVSVYAGSANPVNVTAPIEISTSSGDSVNMYAEAVTMVNANPCPCPLFVWRFFSCQQSTYHTVTATSEREARAQLPDAPCLFAARIRLEGVCHA